MEGKSMSLISFSESWNNRFGDLNLTAGLRAHVHPFYQGWQAFPYRSMRSLVNGLDWLRGFVPTRSTPHDNPNQKAPGWTQGLNGVTHDDRYWYFAQETRLWRIPV